MVSQTALQLVYAQDRATNLLKRFEVAKNKRQQFVSIWQDVANYILPYRGGFYNVEESGAISAFDRNVEIYDDTGTNALIKAASAFYSYTANPATQWFGFGLCSLKNTKTREHQIEYLLAQPEVRNYLNKAADQTAYFINSNSQAAMHSSAQEILAFSAAGLYVIEDFSEAVLAIQPISVKDLYVLNNSRGEVGEVYRTLVLTNEQVLSEFGDKGYLTQEIREAGLKDPLKDRVLVHCVAPRIQRDPSIPNTLNMPFMSVYIDKKSKTIIYESGFEEMPFCVARINVPPGSVFGFSPAMNIRHTVKSLNKLNRQKLSAGDLALNPAMNVPLDTYVNPISMKPAALNYFEPDATNRATPMHVVGNFQITEATIKDAREQVKQGLFIDLIEQSNKDNTYQAMQEQLMQLKLMSPWQGGLEKDFLKPLVIRVFNILNRRGGLLPEMPPVLQEAIKSKSVALKIKYDSPLAKAQQHFKLQATQGVAAFCGQFANFGAMDFLNMEETVRLYTDLIGAPSEIIYSKKQIEEIKKAQEEAQMQQSQMQQQMLQAAQAQQGAAAMKDAAQAQALQAEVGPQGGGQIPGMPA